MESYWWVLLVPLAVFVGMLIVLIPLFIFLDRLLKGWTDAWLWRR